MSKSSLSNQLPSSLSVFPLTGAISFEKKENDVREMHHSSLNLKWGDDVKWNIHIADVIAVRVSPDDAGDMETSGAGKKQYPILSKKEILEWNPIQDLHPKRKGKKDASSTSSTSPIHWRPALVLALGKRMFRTADKKTESEYFINVQWLYRATETKYARELAFKFRPYKPNDKKVQLPYVLLSSSDFAKISPMQVLPATIDMLTQAEINDGVDLLSPNVSNRNNFLSDSHKFQLFKLPFYCPKRINRKGSTIPEEENGDQWSKLSFSLYSKGTGTEVYKSAKEIPIPKPLNRGWTESDFQISDELMVKLRAGFQSDQYERQQHAMMRKLEVPNEKYNEQNSSSSSDDATKENQRQTSRINRSEPDQPEKQPIKVKNKRKRQDEVGQSKKAKVIDSSRKTKLSGKKKDKRKDETTEGDQREKNVLKTKKPLGVKANSAKKASTTKHSISKQAAKKQNKLAPKNSAVRPRSSKIPVRRLSKTVDTAELSPKFIPLSEPIFSTKKRQYYNAIRLECSANDLVGKFLSLPDSWTVSIKSIVAIRYDGNLAPLKQIFKNTGRNKWYPFSCCWAVGQVVALYQEMGNFMASIRWLERPSDINGDVSQLSNLLLGSAQSGKMEVVETNNVDDCPLESALPGRLVITSRDDEANGVSTLQTSDEGLPIVPLLCQHRQDRTGWTTANDWTDYDNVPAELNGPFRRGLQCAADSKACSFPKTLIRKSIIEPLSPKLVQKGHPKAPIAVRKLQARACSSPKFEINGMRFYDDVEITFASTAKSEVSSVTKNWKIGLGHVVPLRYQDNRRYEAGAWLPFSSPWSPAQVVSIYQDLKEDMAWMMEVRWFDRYKTLPALQQQGLDRATTDQKHVVVETEHYQHVEVSAVYPGRVVLTSFAPRYNGSFWDEVANLDGIPFIPRQCCHMCSDDEIHDVTWTNYDIDLQSLPPQLRRGLQLSPANRRTDKKLIKQLWQVYSRSVQSRPQVDEEILLRKWEVKEADCPTAEMYLTQPFDPEKANVRFGQVWCSSPTASGMIRDFSDSVRISAVADHIIQKFHSRKNERNNQFEARVGDIICFADEKAKCSKDGLLAKSRWHPFTVKWSLGQILAIYRDDGQVEGAAIRLEVRRLLRESDLPICVKAWMPPRSDSNVEEVYESDLIIADLSASYVLGMADLYLGLHTATSSRRMENITRFLPKVSCRCRYFYLSEAERFQPLHCFGLEAEKWGQRFLERGLMHISKTVPDSEELSTKVQSLLGRIEPNILGSHELEREEPSAFSDEIMKEKSSGGTRYYTCVSMTPSWPDYTLCDVLYHREERSDKSVWKLRISDIVAVKYDCSDNAPITTLDRSGSHSWHPFKGPWFACQVLAIFSSLEDKANGRSFNVEVQPLSLGENSDSNIPILLGSTDQPTRHIESQAILGPLTLFPKRGTTSAIWNRVSWNVPVAPVHYDDCDSSLKARRSLRSRIQKSKHYSDKEIDKLMTITFGSKQEEDADIDKECEANNIQRSKLSDPAEGTCWISVKPMHVDKASLRAFYTELNIIPPYENYEKCNLPKEIKPWTVKIGDIVEINVGQHKRHPFKVQGGGKKVVNVLLSTILFLIAAFILVCEVVCIFREFKNENDLSREAYEALKERDISDDTMLEVRWFYRRSEVPGVSCGSSMPHFEEVLETDELDVVPASRLLAPAVLHDDPNEWKRSDRFLGMPVQDYVCLHFWSLNRKSLIPSSGLGGINERGRLYSKFLPKKSFADSNTSDLMAMTDVTTKYSRASVWKDAFTSVIKKLTLRDASTQAYDNGAGLVGREKEMDRIMSFLKGAIGGDVNSDGFPSSMFLAGPPGVGKTGK